MFVSFLNFPGIQAPVINYRLIRFDSDIQTIDFFHEVKKIIFADWLWMQPGRPRESSGY